MKRRRVLMIAFHFPPMKGSSGMQRTLAFSRYLLEDHNWDPIVLTASLRAYPTTSNDQMSDIAAGVKVVRAPALDAARHLALRGRYARFTALPDRWVSWWPGAVLQGFRLIKRVRPSLIWSTYPIATAHKIGLTLHHRTGLPWVADFRDSMTEVDYPTTKSVWESHRRIEESTVKHALVSVFTTRGARQMYLDRYQDIDASRFHVIENGYDEATFPPDEPRDEISRQKPFRMLHSGLLYRSERDPRCFFEALAILKTEGQVSSETLRVTLRASGDEEYHASLISEFDIAELVELAPPVAYREALREMMNVHLLLIFQGASCNHQIPAKLYEYFRAGRPVLALTDLAGDTADLVRRSNRGVVASLDSPVEIASAISRLITSDCELEQTSNATVPASYSRRARAAELAELLDRVT